MDTLDIGYLAKLVELAREGNQNAFAQLYTATYQRQYRYSFQYLQSEELAKEALEECYLQALQQISSLQNPELFLAWLSRINLRICFAIKTRAAGEEKSFEHEVLRISNRDYTMNQVMNLPLTESQALILFYYQEMPMGDICRELSVSRNTLWRYLVNGKKHLEKLIYDI